MQGLAKTWVDLLHAPGRIERCLRFGHPTQRLQLDAQRERLQFPPRAVFAVLSQRDGGHERPARRLSILRTVSPGQAFSLLPGIEPGAQILLDLKQPLQVERALAAIADLEQAGFRAEQIASDHWVNLAGRIVSGLPIRSYDHRLDRAWRTRRRQGA